MESALECPLHWRQSQAIVESRRMNTLFALAGYVASAVNRLKARLQNREPRFWDSRNGKGCVDVESE